MNNKSIMEAIREGKVRMRPRWQFLFSSALSSLSALFIFLLLLYVASLAVFILRDSGAWFAPSFGGRGWIELLRSIPWLLIVCMLALVFLLEVVVKDLAFIYKKPLLISASGIVFLIVLGGMLLPLSPLHRSMGDANSPIGFLYRSPLRMPRPDDAYHGSIIAFVPRGFVMTDEDGAGTTTVYITPKTRLPYGDNFEVGERIVVIGDREGTGTVEAFGVREIDEYR